MNKLEQKGRFKDSLFLIVSDTGSDAKSMRSLTEPKTTIQKYNENMSKIFTILHHPTQKKGVVVRDRLFQEDIFQLMTEKGGDTKMHFGVTTLLSHELEDVFLEKSIPNHNSFFLSWMV